MNDLVDVLFAQSMGERICIHGCIYTCECVVELVTAIHQNRDEFDYTRPVSLYVRAHENICICIHILIYIYIYIYTY